MSGQGEVERLPQYDSELLYLVDALELLERALASVHEGLAGVRACLVAQLIADDDEGKGGDTE